MFSSASSPRACWAIIALLGYATVVTGIKVNNRKGGRIILGHEAKRDRVGFIAQVRQKTRLYGYDNMEFVCPATIISERYLVSAAHCFKESMELKSLKVVFGQTELQPVLPDNKSLKTRGVQQVFIHPDYIDSAVGAYNADVAVIKVKSKIGFGKFTTMADLCSGPLEDGTKLTVYGWGSSDEGEAKVHTNKLKQVTVPVVSTAKCRAAYGEGVITDLMICAGLDNGKDSCQGDSGGPAMRGNTLCGIVSWGQECGSDVYPGIYTNVTAVRDFIEDCMRQ